MRTKFEHALSRRAILIAGLALLLGIFCLVVLRRSSDTGLVAIGYYYTFLEALIVVTLLFTLLWNAFRYPRDFREHFMATMPLLANLPVPLVYWNLL